MKDNKKFWDRFAFIYERVQKTGKEAESFYEQLGQEVANQLNPDMKVLELAMGPAMLTEKIARNCKQLLATDYSEKMVIEAKKKQLPQNVKIEQADATNLSYEAASFDAIVIANALHIMPEPGKAIMEMKRVLKDDGVIIAPTYTRELKENKLKLKIMNAVGFITYFPWNDEAYRNYLTEHDLRIIFSDVIMWSNFPESFVVCKKN